MFACESVPLSQGSPRGLRQKSLGHLTLKVGKSDFRQQIRSMAIFLPTDPNFLIKILVPNFTLNENSFFLLCLRSHPGQSAQSRALGSPLCPTLSSLLSNKCSHQYGWEFRRPLYQSVTNIFEYLNIRIYW